MKPPTRITLALFATAITTAIIAIAQNPPPPAGGLPPVFFSKYSGIKFVLIPAGNLTMGSDHGEPDELPVHEEFITKPFYMGVTEVTQEQWDKVMGLKMPDRSAHKEKGKPNLPVENVSIGKCRAFCEELSKAENRKCRLPTEAEWEYACRAGTTGEYSCGNSATELVEAGWSVENSGGSSHEVGVRKPNPWGLYDMHGNVWEHCDTYYFDRYDIKRNNSLRLVVRGGAYNSRADECRSANRWAQSNTAQRKEIGFRVVIEAPAQ